MTKEEFTSVLLPHKNSMFRMANCLLQNTEEAEDTVQEAFIKVWNRKMKIRDIKNPVAFLMSVTRNLCIDKLRGNKITGLTLDEDITGSNKDHPADMTEHNQMISIVKKLMTLLPEQQRTVLQLRDVEGLPYEEIEKITGWETNYVRVNLSRGRKKIRETLIKIQEYETARA